MSGNRLNSNPVLAFFSAVLGVALGSAIYFFALWAELISLFFFTAPVFFACFFYARFAKPNFVSTLVCLVVSYLAMRWMNIALDPFQHLAESMGYNESSLVLLLEPILCPSPLFIGHYVNVFFLILIAILSQVHYRKKFWETKLVYTENHLSTLPGEEAKASVDSYATRELFSSSPGSSSLLFGTETAARQKKGRRRQSKGNSEEESLF